MGVCLRNIGTDELDIWTEFLFVRRKTGVYNKYDIIIIEANCGWCFSWNRRRADSFGLTVWAGVEVRGWGWSGDGSVLGKIFGKVSEVTHLSGVSCLYRGYGTYWVYYLPEHHPPWSTIRHGGGRRRRPLPPLFPPWRTNHRVFLLPSCTSVVACIASCVVGRLSGLSTWDHLVSCKTYMYMQRKSF